MEGRGDEADQAGRGRGTAEASPARAPPQGDEAPADHRPPQDHRGARGQGACCDRGRFARKKTNRSSKYTSRVEECGWEAWSLWRLKTRFRDRLRPKIEQASLTRRHGGRTKYTVLTSDPSPPPLSLCRRSAARGACWSSCRPRNSGRWGTGRCRRSARLGQTERASSRYVGNFPLVTPSSTCPSHTEVAFALGCMKAIFPGSIQAVHAPRTQQV